MDKKTKTIVIALVAAFALVVLIGGGIVYSLYSAIPETHEIVNLLVDTDGDSVADLMILKGYAIETKSFSTAFTSGQ
jgi:hypothetical protein